MLLLVITAYLSVAGATTVAPIKSCETAPPHAQPADANYRLNVAGDPDLFLTGELYTVSLQGVDSGQGPTPFTGFTIWVEVEHSSSSDNQSLGAFQAYDAQTKQHEFCKPAVDNATTHSKTEVQVIWSAPINAVDVCVRLCARASSGESSSVASVLARKLCAAPAAPASFARHPPIVEPCCACDEAKYEVTFESLWSRNTHPREFPPESARAHFGDVIGASHTAQYRVWQEGRAASMGLRRLADDGATTALEKELKSESDHIRTIIKARGISWKQVAGGAGNPSTFAVFRVDAKHHLVSLAAKLAPSPDWIVGVSALELCNANCTWRTSITFPLYPYDAGTDNGMEYMSRRSPTMPSSPVRALRPDWPKDPRSPFYSSTGEMRPFARLRFNRLRLYEKSCDVAEGSESAAEVGGASCATHTWEAWGPCSVSCGRGRAARQRHYVWPARAFADACRVPLTDYRRCYGPQRDCRAPSEYEPDPAESSGPCAVSSWSEWSPCSGCGIRARSRHYLAERAHKRCHVGYRARTEMHQAMPCDAGPCHRPPGEPVNSTNFDWFYVDMPRGECETTPWGAWSPCSARCGRGRRLRARLYTAWEPALQRELAKRLTANWARRYAQLQNLDVGPENGTETAAETAVERQATVRLERCHATHTLQEALCDGPDFSCYNASMAKEICSFPMEVGHCRAYEERWFYDVSTGACEPLGYTGCGGNANNFKNRDDCLRICGVNKTEATVAPAQNDSLVKTKSPKATSDNEVMQNDGPPNEDAKVDCHMGPWLGWSECLGECDYGIRLNYRLISRVPSGGGKPCSRVIKSRTCRPSHCRKLLLSTEAIEPLNTTHVNYDDD